MNTIKIKKQKIRIKEEKIKEKEIAAQKIREEKEKKYSCDKIVKVISKIL